MYTLYTIYKICIFCVQVVSVSSSVHSYKPVQHTVNIILCKLTPDTTIEVPFKRA